MIVLAALVGFLIKKLDENAKKDDARTKELKEYVKAQVDGLETRIDGRVKALEARAAELEGRSSYIEREYLPREDHYRDISGWRTEINRLVDAMMNHLGRKA